MTLETSHIPLLFLPSLAMAREHKYPSLTSLSLRYELHLMDALNELNTLHVYTHMKAQCHI